MTEYVFFLHLTYFFSQVSAFGNSIVCTVYAVFTFSKWNKIIIRIIIKQRSGETDHFNIKKTVGLSVTMKFKDVHLSCHAFWFTYFLTI